MTTAIEIGQFLLDRQLAATLPEGLDTTAVTGVHAEESAGSGSLGWLSRSRFERDPSRVEQFRGAILIVPLEAVGARPLTGFCVPCRSPKLAFSRVVERFFPDALRTAWATPSNPETVGSVIAATARMGPGVVIGSNCLIGDGVEIGPNTTVAHCSIGANTRIGANCTIGLSGFGFDRDESGEWFRFPHLGRVEIEESVEIGSNTCIDRGSLSATRIRRGAKIDNLVHIAHNVTIESNALIIANAMIGGSAQIGEGAWVAPSASVMNQVSVGRSVTVGMGAVVTKHVRDGVVVAGVPAKEIVARG